MSRREKGLKPETHLFLGLCVAMVLGFLVWAWVGKIDIVSIADGEVIPSSKVKRIQHLEGGIVRNILVKEGDNVTQGQELLVLESTATDSSVEELTIRLASLAAEIAWLEAEVQGKDFLEFPEKLEEMYPEVVEQARKLYAVRATKRQSEISAQKQAIGQVEQSINEVQARLRNTARSLGLLREQIAISKDLLKDKLTTKYKHLSFLQEESRLVSRIEEDRAAFKRLEAALASERERLKSLTQGHQEEARMELRGATREYDEMTQRLRKYSDSLDRTVVRSPVNGVVKSVFVVGEGEVVRPGVTIMDIVPGGDRLIVEAHLPISDIGYVRKEQKAIIRLATRDASRYGSLDGEVVHVSPDVVTVQEGGVYRTYYKVLVATDNSYFDKDGNIYNLFPGMLVLVSIHIGKRSILEYMLEPFVTSFGNALQER